jgi:hypothetical protein
MIADVHHPLTERTSVVGDVEVQQGVIGIRFYEISY